jgi:hypothetical protein
MLNFCNNLLGSGAKFVVNTQTNECFALILKNGSTTLKSLAIDKPELFKVVSEEYVKNNSIKTVTVFVRDAITRVLSGLATQSDTLQIPKHVIEHTLNQQEYFHIYDAHTAPQFWFLLKISRVLDVNFQIKPLSDIQYVDTDVPHKNVNSNTVIRLTNPIMIEKLIHFYTEDIVLYNQFLNTTCSIDSIIEKIKLEKNFVDDLQQYRSILTYLL